MTHLEDREIIDLFFERSERAIRELDSKYGKAVKAIAGNVLRDRQDAEECVNDAYLGVWSSIPPQRPDSLGSYVCRIARNQAISRLRSNTAAKRNEGFDLVLDELEECIPSGISVEAELEGKELARAVDRFLATLDYDDRFLFVRRYFFADSVKQIAAAMGRKENQLSVRLFRLREKLRKNLVKEGLLV